MWKRDEAVRPPARKASGSAGARSNVGPTGAAGASQGDVVRSSETDVVNIGRSVVIDGQLNGSEDLTIEGEADGSIELRDNILTIGPHAGIRADVFAKSVIVLGKVTGDITASEKVNIRENGSVDGDIAAPRVAIAEGAHFRGSIDMQRHEGAKDARAKVVVSPSSAESQSSRPPKGTKPVLKSPVARPPRRR